MRSWFWSWARFSSISAVWCGHSATRNWAEPKRSARLGMRQRIRKTQVGCAPQILPRGISDAPAGICRRHRRTPQRDSHRPLMSTFGTTRIVCCRTAPPFVARTKESTTTLDTVPLGAHRKLVSTYLHLVNVLKTNTCFPEDLNTWLLRWILLYIVWYRSLINRNAFIPALISFLQELRSVFVRSDSQSECSSQVVCTPAIKPSPSMAVWSASRWSGSCTVEMLGGFLFFLQFLSYITFQLQQFLM